MATRMGQKPGAYEPSQKSIQTAKHCSSEQAISLAGCSGYFNSPGYFNLHDQGKIETCMKEKRSPQADS